MQISLQMGWNLALMIIFTCGTSEWHDWIRHSPLHRRIWACLGSQSGQSERTS